MTKVISVILSIALASANGFAAVSNTVPAQDNSVLAQQVMQNLADQNIVNPTVEQILGEVDQLALEPAQKTAFIDWIILLGLGAAGGWYAKKKMDDKKK